MKKRIVWLMMSCLMVTALLLASCGPAAVEEEEEVVAPGEEEVAPSEEEVVVTEEKEMVRDSLGRLVEKPRYGGTLIAAFGSNPLGFDDCYIPTVGQVSIAHLTNEGLLQGDWAKGPSGTGEAGWLIRGTMFLEYERGCVAESWEQPDPNTIVYHIRKGIYWHSKPPVNGRELTAHDVVWSIERAFEVPESAWNGVIPEGIESITAPDKWTVVLKCHEGTTAYAFSLLSDVLNIMPPELGIEGQKDWRNVVGTGPFMLVDFVSMSSATLTRNPNYWDTHPLYPEDTMPYLDGVKWLVIPDSSTQMSAMRTGKIDLLGVGWENAEDLMEANPELKWSRYLQAYHLNIIYMRTDKPDLPFYDIRVRRALAMGLDQEAMLEYYLGGNGELLSTPVAPYAEFMSLFIPLEELPESVREQYEYHPDKARQLLAEAGYPDGFETEIVCSAGWADMLSIVKADWAKIGVDLELDVRELAVWYGMTARHNHNEMIMGYLSSVAPYQLTAFRPGPPHNMSMVDDERCNEAWEVIQENVVFNDAKVQEVLKELHPYILEQCWYIETPSPYLYRFWQPWLKGYNGEYTVGMESEDNFPIWVWLDQDLKYEMTGKR